MAPLPLDATAGELEAEARRLLPGPIFDFISGGAEDEETLAENQAAFHRYRLVPRVMRDMATIDTGITLFGSPLAAPLLVAPMGVGHRIAHPEGELASARAAAAVGIGYMTSTGSSYPLEEIAGVAGKGRWFQAYCWKDRGITADLVERATAAGYEAICLTVDGAVGGLRRRDVRNRLRFPPGVTFANFERYEAAGAPNAPETLLRFVADQVDPSVTWRDLEWLSTRTSLPIVVKGVMSPDDARLAVDTGAAGVVVSNHGGRQLDGAPAALEMLPEVVEAVGADVPVLLDSGVRRARDVVVALSLGATAVTVGRPVLWALACGGEERVRAFLDDLVTGLRRSLALLGCTSVSALDGDALRART